jgi:hypothetical protein
LHRQPRGGHDVARSSARSDHPAVERGDVEAIQRRIDRLDLIVANVRNDAAERGRDAGIERNESSLQAHFADQCADMQCAAAAERHRREPRRIVTPLHRYKPNRTRHLGVRHAHDGFGCGFGAKTQRFADMRLDCAASSLDVEACQSPADRALCIDATQHNVGIGQSRPRVARTIASWTGRDPALSGPP